MQRGGKSRQTRPRRVPFNTPLEMQYFLASPTDIIESVCFQYSIGDAPVYVYDMPQKYDVKIVFQYSIGDAMGAVTHPIGLKISGNFQYSIGDATSTHATAKRWTAKFFQYSIGDARGVGSSARWLWLHASPFNTPLEMPQLPLRDCQSVEDVSFNTPLEMRIRSALAPSSGVEAFNTPLEMRKGA